MSEQGIRRFIRPDLRELAGYTPIEPVEVLAERLGIPPERIIKLDGNENLYGPTPRARKALAEYNGYHIYPDPSQHRLRQALAEYAGVPLEYIVAGAGSDELIDLVFRALLSPGDKVLSAVPTFGMYSFSAEVNGAEFVGIPRREDFSLDMEAITAAIDYRTKLIVLPNPNNPSGNLLSRMELEALLYTGLPIVIDEAYIEFAEAESLTPLVPERENLIVLRTFSKWAGLAGLRIGFGVLPLPLVDLLMTIKPPYTPNVAAEVAALASLEDRETAGERIAAIVAERERLFAALQEVPFLDPLPSRANFLLCRVLNGDAKLLRQRLAERGIFVRYFDTSRLAGYIRISVGRPEHTDALVAALAEIGAVHA